MKPIMIILLVASLAANVGGLFYIHTEITKVQHKQTSLCVTVGDVSDQIYQLASDLNQTTTSVFTCEARAPAGSLG